MLLEWEFIGDLILRAVIPIVVGGIVASLGMLWKRLTAFQTGLTAMMRDRLVQGAKYYIKQGYMPLEERTSYELMYEAYHRNGGNGVVTDLYERTMALPYSLPEAEPVGLTD